MVDGQLGNEIDGCGDDVEQFVCAQCGGAANQRCTGCHITFYCSREHQKLHWKKHKSSCCAYKVRIRHQLIINNCNCRTNFCQSSINTVAQTTILMIIMDTTTTTITVKMVAPGL